jgi:hypothetical protein
VVSINILENGNIITTAEHNNREIVFVSKQIVLSNGAKQKLHPLFETEWFPKARNVILSDHFLTSAGYHANKDNRKITIIGSSHSGFSCAWLFLNGPKRCSPDISIKILYRDKVRVYYENLDQATRDGYADYDADLFSKRKNCLYGYTGLRSDAKELWQKIRDGKEKRVKLVQAPTFVE